MSFWNDLDKESQKELKCYRKEGKYIEAQELMIALSEEYTQYDPQMILWSFTQEFKKRYDVECVSALQHNKTRCKYHIHLIFSKRRLLPKLDIKIDARSVFYDETGKRVHTKKEIIGEDGQIRESCTIIKRERSTKAICLFRKTRFSRTEELST